MQAKECYVESVVSAEIRWLCFMLTCSPVAKWCVPPLYLWVDEILCCRVDCQQTRAHTHRKRERDARTHTYHFHTDNACHLKHTKISWKYVRLLNFHILSLSVRMLSLRREWTLCLCSGTMYKQTTKHTTPLHRTIVVTFFSSRCSLFFRIFILFLRRLLLLTFVYSFLITCKQTSKQRHNHRIPKLFLYLFEFPIVCIKRQTERILEIYPLRFTYRIFLRFVFVSFSIFTYCQNIHLFKWKCRWFYWLNRVFELVRFLCCAVELAQCTCAICEWHRTSSEAKLKFGNKRSKKPLL